MYLFPYVLLLHPYILVLVFLTIQRPTFQNHKMPVKTTNMPEKKIETCKKLNRNWKHKKLFPPKKKNVRMHPEVRIAEKRFLSLPVTLQVFNIFFR